MKKSKVQWIDADGTILKEENIVISDSTAISYPLPQDSVNWHYTEWIKTTTSEGFIYNAKRVPKKNVLGEEILEPEHVQIGLNYNVICQDITDTESIIRELRRIEHDILKILKKRVDE